MIRDQFKSGDVIVTLMSEDDGTVVAADISICKFTLSNLELARVALEALVKGEQQSENI